MPQENGISCLEVSAVEASDSSWKRRGLIQSAEHMRSGQHDLSSALLGSSTQLNIVAATQIISSNSECSDHIQIHQFKNCKHPLPGVQKPLSLRNCLFNSYHHYITQSSELDGLWHLITLKVLMFSHCGNRCLCWQINSKTGLIQPISPVFSFLLLFISPHLSGMMTVSHNAGQREPGCSWAECWKACAITHAPLLRALQRWRDWEGEWWAFNTRHNRAPQPQTGTIFTLS